MSNTLLTMTEASRRVGISAEWLRMLATKGQIPCVRLSNGIRAFALADLERFAEERRKRKKPIPQR